MTEIAMTNERRTLITVAIAGSFLLAACSSSTAPAGSPRSTVAPPAHSAAARSQPAATGDASSATGAADPCSLLTQAEVDTAAGQPLGHGNRIGALDDCQWSTSDFAGSVELDLGDWSAIKAKSAQTGQPLTSVAGLGDEALSLNAAGNAAQLFVRTGTTGFQLLLGGGQRIGSEPDLGLGAEKALASAVLGRL
jgi:hypothetical protein